MGIESSASLLSTQIINIIHENNPDAKEAKASEKTNEMNESKLEVNKDKSSVFKETSVRSSETGKEAAPEVYNEHGYVNQTAPSANTMIQSQKSIDIEV